MTPRMGRPVDRASAGSGSGPERGGSGIDRRLGVVPTAVAATALVVHVIGIAATGIVTSTNDWYWVAVATVLLLWSMVSGHVAGLYGGLAVSAALALTSGRAMSTIGAVVLVVTVVLVHEVGRFSLDARRPSRFGPGLISTYVARSSILVGLVAVLSAALWPLIEPSLSARTLPPSLLPIGVAAAGLPLLVPRLVELVDRRFELRAGAGRALVVWVAAAVGFAAATVVVLAAQARTAIETGSPPDGPARTTTTTTPTTVPVPVEVQSDVRSVVLVALLLLLVLFALLLAALRRPEAVFELDEKVFEEDHTGLGWASPERADMDEELIGLDQARAGRLLDDLALDLTTEPDPGRAIRFGYAGVERRLAGLGLTRTEAETEREFLARALPALSSQGRSLADLTRLFERARFGVDPPTEGMRTAALDAIDDLRPATGMDVDRDDAGGDDADGGGADGGPDDSDRPGGGQ